ncbi:hypothetical protein EMCG_05471 [[Emmonsia] crescens]|uniref:Uncharacterized protein n=1 Tax=[Emmonsia] crescens TaxID=73230 RepID=A0A0G2HNM2_9EURO|nr:hypothetical protein EMCG_05471 [Emmonsia crescens UAMH 3008]
MSTTDICISDELHILLYSLHEMNEDTVSFYDYIKSDDLSDSLKFNEESQAHRETSLRVSTDLMSYFNSKEKS